MCARVSDKALKFFIFMFNLHVSLKDMYKGDSNENQQHMY